MLKVNLLNHLQTRNSDKSVKSHANAAHYARGDRVNECNEGRKEGDSDSRNCSCYDSNNGCVTGDCYTTNRLAVCGVGTSAEHSTYHRAYTVTKKGSVKAGILEKILLDDGGNVLVVSNMLCKYNESNGSVCYCNGCDVCAVKLIKSAKCVEECKFGKGYEGFNAYAVGNESLKGGEIDNLKRINSCSVSDKSENNRNCIAGENTYNEGNKFCCFFEIFEIKVTFV